MRSIISTTPADAAASERAPLPAFSAPPLASSAAPAGLSGARLTKFLSYYRPHLGLLAADLGCAILVSATALALPLGAKSAMIGALVTAARCYKAEH